MKRLWCAAVVCVLASSLVATVATEAVPAEPTPSVEAGWLRHEFRLDDRPSWIAEVERGVHGPVDHASYGVALTSDELESVNRLQLERTRLSAAANELLNRHEDLFRDIRFDATGITGREMVAFVTRPKEAVSLLREAGIDHVEARAVSFGVDSVRKAQEQFLSSQAELITHAVGQRPVEVRDDPENDRLQIGFVDPASVDVNQIERLIGLPVKIVRAEPAHATYLMRSAYRFYNSVNAAGVWTSAVGGGHCTSNAMTKNVESGGVTRYWIMTAKHCLRNSSATYTDVKDGNAQDCGVYTDHTSSNLVRWVLSDNRDVAFFQTTSGAGSSRMYMRMLNGSQLLRTVTNSSYPVIGETIYMKGKSTEPQPYGMRHGNVNSRNVLVYYADQGLYFYVDELSGGTAQACPGDSGGPVFRAFSGGGSSIVGVLSGNGSSVGGCHGTVYFSEAVPTMQYYGMSIY